MSTEVTIDVKNAFIAKFMGYERVTVGYSSTEEETEWQRNNEQWMDKVGITMVGDYYVDVENDEWMFCDDANYDKSWDALMPVVEKISKIPLLNHDNTPCSDPRDVCHPITFAMPTEDGKQVMFRFKGFGLCIADTLIEAVHEGCYEVAKYHNQQKQNNDTTGTHKG